MERCLVNTVINQFLELLIFRLEIESGAPAAEVFSLARHLQ